MLNLIEDGNKQIQKLIGSKKLEDLSEPELKKVLSIKKQMYDLQRAISQAVAAK